MTNMTNTAATDFNVTVNAADLLKLINAAGKHADALADRANNEPDAEERYRLDGEHGRLCKKIDKLRTKWCAGFLRHQRVNK